MILLMPSHAIFLACVLSAGLAASLLGLLLRSAPALGLVKINHCGNPIADVGAVLWLPVLAGYGLMIWLDEGNRAQWEAYCLLALGVGLAGSIDDRFGNHEARGFRGHAGKLLQGHITTGVLKTVLIPVTAAFSVHLILNESWGLSCLSALLIGLMSNGINVLDIRPGRAGTGWLLLACLLTLMEAARHGPIGPLLIMVGPLLVYLPKDIDCSAMMGDTGSNLLGSLLGLHLVISLSPGGQPAVIAALMGVMVFAELNLHHENIADHPLVRWLDFFVRPPVLPG